MRMKICQLGKFVLLTNELNILKE